MTLNPFFVSFIIILSLLQSGFTLRYNDSSNCRAIFKSFPVDVPMSTYGDCDVSSTIVFVALPLFEASVNVSNCGAPGSVFKEESELVVPEIVHFVMSRFPNPLPSVAIVIFPTCGDPYSFISYLFDLVVDIQSHLSSPSSSAGTPPPGGSLAHLKRLVVVGEDDSPAVVSFLATGLDPFQPVTYVNFRSNDVSLTQQPHLFQSVPNTNDFLSAFARLLEAYGWTNIGVLVEDSVYWKSLAERFYGMLGQTPRDQQIKIAYTLTVFTSFNDDDIDFLLENYIQKLYYAEQARVVIFFGSRKSFQIIHDRLTVNKFSPIWMLFQETLPYIRSLIEKQLTNVRNLLGSFILSQTFAKLPSNFTEHLKISSHYATDPFLAECLRKQSAVLGRQITFVDYDAFRHFDDHINFYNAFYSILQGLEYAEKRSCALHDFSCLSSGILSTQFESLAYQGTTFTYNLQGLARVGLDILNIKKYGSNFPVIESVGRYVSRTLDPQIPSAVFYNNLQFEVEKIDSKLCGPNGCGWVEDLMAVKYVRHFDLPLHHPPRVYTNTINVVTIFLMLKLKDEHGNFHRTNMENLLAFDWALRTINEQNKILPGIRILIKSLNTFGSEQIAESTMRSLLVDQGAFISPITKPQHEIALSVVGDSVLDSSKGIQFAITDMQVPFPQVGITDDPEMNRRDRYQTFLRAVPSKTMTIDVLIALLQNRDLTYVHVLRDSSATSVRLAMLLEQKIKGLTGDRKICVATDNQLRTRDVETIDNMKRILKRMMLVKNANVVISLVGPDRMVEMMYVASIVEAFGHLQWIGVDDWFNEITINDTIKQTGIIFSLHSFTSQMLGSIVIVPKRTINVPFLNYFKSLNLTMIGSSPNLVWREFFYHFWMSYFKCNLGGSFQYDRTCTGDETLDSPKTTYESYDVEAMMQVAFLLTKAFRAHLQSICGIATICSTAITQVVQNSDTFYQNLMGKIETTSIVGDPLADSLKLRPLILTQRNASAYFAIRNVQKGTLANTFKIVNVGSHESNELQLNDLLVSAYGPKRERINLVSKCEKDSVCGDCVQIGADLNTFNLSISSPTLKPSDQLKTAGYDPNEPELEFFASRIWGMIVFGIVILGFLSSFATLVLLVLDFKNEVHVQSSPILNYILNIAICLTFLFCLTFLVASTPRVCAVRRIVFAPLHALLFSCLLAKSIRNARIDRFKQKCQRDIPMVYAGSQLLVVTSLFAVQVVISLEWVLLVPSTSTFLLISPTVPYLPPRWSCSFDGIPFYFINIYSLFLLLLTLIHSWINRRTKFADKETWFISLASLFCCLAWILWTVWYFLSEGEIQLLSICLLLIVESLSIFIFLIVIKWTNKFKTLELKAISIISQKSALSSRDVVFQERGAIENYVMNHVEHVTRLPSNNQSKQKERIHKIDGTTLKISKMSYFQ